MSRPPSAWSSTVANRPASARPRTANGPASRPGTARPQTASSESNFVVAVIEGRGVGRELGLAALDKDTGRVMLVQLADCQSYVKTLHRMHMHMPSLILVPDTALATDGDASSAKSSIFLNYVQEEFPGVLIEPVARKYWNDGGGIEFVNQLCVHDDERAGTILAASDKYYALSAVCALFKYSEHRLNTRFSAHSLLIRYVPVESTMMIDPETARNLELVGNMARTKSTHSLMGTIGHTFTAMGARLLRVNILAPITVAAAIDARLDVVEELVKSEDLFKEVREALKALNNMDFDKLVASLAASDTRPTITTAKTAFVRVSQMLSLRNAVKSLPLLQNALAGSKSQILRIIHDQISDERIEKMESLVAESLNEDSAPAKGGIAAVNARVFAVKAGRHCLLDVARETFKENIGDIYGLCQELSNTHELPLTVIYQDSGGFMFTMKKAELAGREGELPRGFVNVTAQKGRWVFSSLELKKKNARMKDALEETLVVSDKIIQDLISELLVDIGILYKASEAVALLDMLWSFAHASIMRNYVRPEFTGTLAIKAGRHPILEGVQAAGTLVPNDVYCCDSSTFQIVQGPNMSGKSTYLQQIALLTVMAMCGCFVPAEYGSFRIHDSLLTRLSNDDNIERNLSTFANEMSSTAMILGLATSDSLIIIDELGRGTSPLEGIGISHAIAEELIRKKCFVFFATHFQELSITLSRQPSVVNLHLSVQKTRQSAANFGIVFQYKIMDGVPTSNHHYGLELAKLADLPESVLEEGKRVAECLAALRAHAEAQSQTSKIATRRKALLRLRTQLTQAYEHSELPERELTEYLARLQKDIVKVLRETL